MQEPEDFAKRLRLLEQDRAHGASELARQALKILADNALQGAAGSVDELRALLSRRAGLLAGARPSMAPLHNLLERWQCSLGELASDDMGRFRRAAAEEALALIESSRRAVQEVASHACNQLAQGSILITHSLSSTMMEVFRQHGGKGLKAIVSESRPLNEGYNLAAEISRWGIATRLITDAQIGLFAKEADVAMVGADSLLPDGGVLNKAGTYLLALASRDLGVPFYVACESFKLRTPEMGKAELEEMDPAELKAPELPNVEVRNVYFDITPPSLITGWISERGLIREWDGRL